MNLAARDRIEAGGRLIEDVEIGIVQHRHGQGEALPLSTGQSAHHRLGFVDEIDPLEHELNPAQAGHHTVWLRIERSIQLQRFGDRQVLDERRRLQLHADAGAQRAGGAGGIEPEHRDRSGGRRAQAFEDLDEGRLAGAVGPEQADDLSGSGNREIDAAQRVHRRRRIFA